MLIPLVERAWLSLVTLMVRCGATLEASWERRNWKQRQQKKINAYTLALLYLVLLTAVPRPSVGGAAYGNTHAHRTAPAHLAEEMYTGTKTCEV